VVLGLDVILGLGPDLGLGHLCIGRLGLGLGLDLGLILSPNLGLDLDDSYQLRYNHGIFHYLRHFISGDHL
jgi:hypothetical protein